MGLLGTALGWVGSKLVRTVITTDDNGEESTKRQVTPFGKTSAVIIGCALLYHYIVWPMLNYHYPQYGFPDIDAIVLSAIGGIGM